MVTGRRPRMASFFYTLEKVTVHLRKPMFMQLNNLSFYQKYSSFLLWFFRIYKVQLCSDWLLLLSLCCTILILKLWVFFVSVHVQECFRLTSSYDCSSRNNSLDYKPFPLLLNCSISLHCISKTCSTAQCMLLFIPDQLRSQLLE